MTPAEVLADLEAKVARYEARLEIDHAFELVRNGEEVEMVRFEISVEDRGTYPDAVECRDATIALQDEAIAELTADRDHWRALADEREQMLGGEVADLIAAYRERVRVLERELVEGAE
jgi:hypothetical protein